MAAEVLLGVSRGHKSMQALLGLLLVAIVAAGCGGGESKSVETAAPQVVAPTATPPAQPGATGVAAAATPGLTATQPAAGVAGLGPMARLEALMRQEFTGVSNVGLPRLFLVQVREDREGGYRVDIEFNADDVPLAADERGMILARKRLIEERMQHAFLTLYTSGVDVNNAFISARFLVRYTGKDAYAVIYRTWMTREKAAGVKWQDPSLDLRTAWEVPLLNTSYR